MHHRLLGVLLVASGVLFLAAVLNPPVLPHWGDDRSAAATLASAHRGAWFATLWLLSLAIVAAAAAIEAMARLLNSEAARIGRGLYLVGAALGLASTTYDLAVTSTLHDATTVPTGTWASGAGPTGSARRTSRCSRRPRWSPSRSRSGRPGLWPDGPRSSWSSPRPPSSASTRRSAAPCRSRSSSPSSRSAPVSSPAAPEPACRSRPITGAGRGLTDPRSGGTRSSADPDRD
jgi:hypothetical protein